MIANGMPWKAHLYLMIVSAKLLADTEGMLQVQAVQGSWSGVLGRPLAKQVLYCFTARLVDEVVCSAQEVCQAWERASGFPLPVRNG